MKKAIIISCISIAGLIVLEQSGILNSLLMFLLVGAIPGTDYNVPSSIMMLLIASVIWLLFFRFAAIEALYSISVKRSAKRIVQQKKRMPKRRFSEI
jgi:hypothetical protein